MHGATYSRPASNRPLTKSLVLNDSSTTVNREEPARASVKGQKIGQNRGQPSWHARSTHP